MAIDAATPASKLRPPTVISKVLPTTEKPVPSEQEVQVQVQVPSTVPQSAQPSTTQDSTEGAMFKEQENQTEPIDKDENPSEDDSEDSSADLPDFNFEEIRKQYTAAMKELREEEDKVQDEFDAYASLFSVWAISASSHDTTRALKRMKTRERYVELSEESLAKKKDHYENVVKAFQNALDLLRT